MLMLPDKPAGLNEVPETPLPDQIPPVVDAAVKSEVRFKALADWQIEAGAVHEAFADGTTFMA